MLRNLLNQFALAALLIYPQGKFNKKKMVDAPAVFSVTIFSLGEGRQRKQDRRN